MSSSSEKIIKTYPELSVFQVEYEGQIYDCNKCIAKGQCCGAQNSQFNKSGEIGNSNKNV